MAGFFGLFDFNKPGKGVDLNAPPKHSFFVFWEILWRKLSRFVFLNLIVFLFLLPIITFLYFQLYGMVRQLIPEYFQEIAREAVAAGQEVESPYGLLPTLLFALASIIPQELHIPLLAVSVLLYGPMTCGFHYILRNYARQEHSWISDFFSQMKKNFLQGMIVGLLEIAVLVLLFFNMTMQPGPDVSQTLSALITLMKYVSIFFFIMALFVRNYLYLMIVTFKLKIRHILKNGWIFAVLGLFRNVLVVVVSILMLALVMLVPLADSILLPLIFFSFCGFTAVYVCYPVIHKYMIRPSLPPDDSDSGQGTPNDPVPRVDPRLLGGE